MTVRILQGDCREVMPTLDACSVDAIVTDPPYGLGFMGKGWDHGVPGAEFWTEALRVAKPGAHLLAFGGTRTFHRLAVAIEDAGWEIRDTVMWVYGSGFPKSHNGPWGGTALKPAWEPICVARKPLIGTVEANWKAHGTGTLNIDGCRIPTDDGSNGGRISTTTEGWDRPWKHDAEAVIACRERGNAAVEKAEALGRWPANLIHDGSEEVLACFPKAPGQIADASSSSSRKTQHVYGDMKRGNGREGEPSADSANEGAVGFSMKPGARRGDAGSAARFFYCAKANRADRNDGLDGQLTDDGRKVPADNAYQRGKTLRQNHHPTVKPTDLMRYLCKLVTPKGGTVLDPFMGSGSTLKAAELEGFSAIGIELDADYCEIARGRVAAVRAKQLQALY